MTKGPATRIGKQMKIITPLNEVGRSADLPTMITGPDMAGHAGERV